jgi:hypothetical protein
VLEGALRLLVDEHPGGDEVPRDLLRGLLLEAPQVTAHLGVQFARLDLVRQAWLGHEPGLGGCLREPRGLVAAESAAVVPAAVGSAPVAAGPFAPAVSPGPVPTVPATGDTAAPLAGPGELTGTTTLAGALRTVAAGPGVAAFAAVCRAATVLRAPVVRAPVLAVLVARAVVTAVAGGTVLPRPVVAGLVVAGLVASGSVAARPVAPGPVGRRSVVPRLVLTRPLVPGTLVPRRVVARTPVAGAVAL